jgi:thiol:disulfide interchange protein
MTRLLVLSCLLAVGGCGDVADSKRARPGKPGEPAKPTPPGQSEQRPVSDFEQALARANAEGKQVFVEFSAVWCGPCQQMKRSTFADARVHGRLAGYVMLFVDSDRDPALSQQFNVRGIPAYFVLRPDRTMLKAGAGYRGPDEFLRWLDE